MTTDTDLTTRTSHRSADEPASGELGGRWPWAGLVAATTLFAFPAVGSEFYQEEVTDGGVGAVYDTVAGNGTLQHVAMVLAFTGAVALGLFGAGFVRFLAARTPRASSAGQLARIGMSAAIGLSIAVAVLKAIYRGGLPDHGDHTMYTKDAVAVLDVVVGQFQYTGLWPLTLVMAAVAALALVHRTLPRWFGIVSAVVLVATLGMALGLGLPYFAGLVGPVWLVVCVVVVLRYRGRPVTTRA
jgi:hypothetical protein